MALSDKGIDTMNMQTDKKARIEKTNPATAAEETIGIGRAKGEFPIAANPIVEPHRWHCTYSLGEEIGNRGMKKSWNQRRSAMRLHIWIERHLSHGACP